MKRAAIQDILADAAQRASAYVRQIATRRVSPTAEAICALDGLGGPLPEDPASPGEVLDLLDRLGSPATMGIGGGRYFGFVNGGVLPAAMAADWMARGWGENAALRIMSPAAGAAEGVVLRR